MVHICSALVDKACCMAAPTIAGVDRRHAAANVCKLCHAIKQKPLQLDDNLSEHLAISTLPPCPAASVVHGVVQVWLTTTHLAGQQQGQPGHGSQGQAQGAEGC